MTYKKTQFKAEKENHYSTENQQRIENHKRIMAHLEAIAKKIEFSTKEADRKVDLSLETS